MTVAVTAATVYTVSGPASTASSVNPALEYVLSNGITVYGSTLDDTSRIAAVVMEFLEIWTDRGTTVDILEAE